MTAHEWGTSRPPGELARSVSIRGDHNVTTNIVIDQRDNATARGEGPYIPPETFFAVAFVGLIIISTLHLWFYAIVAVVAISCAYMVVKWGDRRFRLIDAEERRRAEIVARADQQHQWVCEGDERGVYGCAAPHVRNYRRLLTPTLPAGG